MHFVFMSICLLQWLNISPVTAAYNKVVVCVIDKGQPPICTTTSPSRRQTLKSNIPLYDPYIPRINAAFFTCTSSECQPLLLHSFTQVTPLKKTLKTCFFELTYRCETIRYHNLQNIDRIQFLTDNVRDKKFYLVDCLVYGDGTEVCHRKDKDNDRHDKLMDLGTIVKPNEENILSQNELLCEEDTQKNVNCDFNLISPFMIQNATYRDLVPKKDKILLKSDTFLIRMQYNCFEDWCGYTGRVTDTPTSARRGWQPPHYESPGGKLFRCYYGSSQQVCKRLDLDMISAYRSNALK